MDGKGTETTLKSRVSDNVLTLSNFNFDENSGWTGKGLRLDGVNGYISSLKINRTGQIYFEIVYSKKDITKDCHLIDFRNGALGCSPVIANSYVFNACRDAGLNLGNITIAKGNGLKSKKVDTFSFYFRNEVEVGEILSFFCRLRADNFCDIDLFSLKVYQSPLTPEEIAQNYEYEQSIDRNVAVAYPLLQEEKSYGIGLASQLTDEQKLTFRLSKDRTKFVAGLRYCEVLEVTKYTYSEILKVMETEEWTRTEEV